jgi:hypothetical protein
MPDAGLRTTGRWRHPRANALLLAGNSPAAPAREQSGSQARSSGVTAPFGRGRPGGPMDPSRLVLGIARAALGGGKKKAGKARGILSSSGLLTPASLLGAAGVAWGVWGDAPGEGEQGASIPPPGRRFRLPRTCARGPRPRVAWRRRVPHGAPARGLALRGQGRRRPRTGNEALLAVARAEGPRTRSRRNRAADASPNLRDAPVEPGRALRPRLRSWAATRGLRLQRDTWRTWRAASLTRPTGRPCSRRGPRRRRSRSVS